MSINLPPELMEIIERAMKRLTDEAFEQTCLKEYEDNYRHIIASAVQEAWELGITSSANTPSVFSPSNFKIKSATKTTDNKDAVWTDAHKETTDEH